MALTRKESLGQRVACRVAPDHQTSCSRHSGCNSHRSDKKAKAWHVDVMVQMWTLCTMCFHNVAATPSYRSAANLVTPAMFSGLLAWGWDSLDHQDLSIAFQENEYVVALSSVSNFLGFACKCSGDPLVYTTESSQSIFQAFSCVLLGFSML